MLILLWINKLFVQFVILMNNYDFCMFAVSIVYFVIVFCSVHLVLRYKMLFVRWRTLGRPARGTSPAATASSPLPCSGAPSRPTFTFKREVRVGWRSVSSRLPQRQVVPAPPAFSPSFRSSLTVRASVHCNTKLHYPLKKQNRTRYKLFACNKIIR